MKKQIICLLIVILVSFFFINGVLAENLEFNILLKGVEQETHWEYYNHGGVDIPLLESLFTSFSAEIARTSNSEQGPVDSVQEDDYSFTAQLLDSENNLLDSKVFGANFYVLGEPPTEINETLASVTFKDNLLADHVRVLYDENVILYQEFRSFLCNHNNLCENEFTEYPNMFENYLSCPDDCDYFDLDGICNTVPAQYSFNDGACDRDCSHDMNQGDPEAGECFRPEITKCHPVSNGVTENNQLYSNTCTDSNRLLQYRCGTSRYIFWGSRVRSNIVTCANGCSNGACISQTSTPSSACTDSDGGMNYNVRGTVTQNLVEYGSDECENSSASPTLFEFYCDSSGLASYSSYNCPDICSDGACMINQSGTITELPPEPGAPGEV